MPLYNYLCAAHGAFDDWRPMREAASPAPCPECGALGDRAVSLPSLSLMNGGTRKAHSINERSADQPKIETRTPAANGAGGHGCGGHTHGHGHRHSSSRPWMIGH